VGGQGPGDAHARPAHADRDRGAQPGSRR
jgi:hypothetical protein